MDGSRIVLAQNSSKLSGKNTQKLLKYILNAYSQTQRIFLANTYTCMGGDELYSPINNKFQSSKNNL